MTASALSAPLSYLSGATASSLLRAPGRGWISSSLERLVASASVSGLQGFSPNQADFSAASPSRGMQDQASTSSPVSFLSSLLSRYASSGFTLPSSPFSSANFPQWTPGLIADAIGILMAGGTYKPNNRRRKKRIGFLARMGTRGGRKVLGRKREKGRWILTP